MVTFTSQYVGPGRLEEKDNCHKGNKGLIKTVGASKSVKNGLGDLEYELKSE